MGFGAGHQRVEGVTEIYHWRLQWPSMKEQYREWEQFAGTFSVVW